MSGEKLASVCFDQIEGQSTSITNGDFLLATVAMPINSAYQCIMHAGHVLLLMCTSIVIMY